MLEFFKTSHSKEISFDFYLRKLVEDLEKLNYKYKIT